MKLSKIRRVNLRPDLTPLIDVVFLLLIFFMLSSTFILQPGIKVELPQAKERELPRHTPYQWERQPPLQIVSYARRGESLPGRQRARPESSRHSLVPACSPKI